MKEACDELRGGSYREAIEYLVEASVEGGNVELLQQVIKNHHIGTFLSPFTFSSINFTFFRYHNYTQSRKLYATRIQKS